MHFFHTEIVRNDWKYWKIHDLVHLERWHLCCLLLVKIALFNEILIAWTWTMSHCLSAIPFLARASMNIYFTTIHPAKDKGIAHFFKEKISDAERVFDRCRLQVGLVFYCTWLWTGKCVLTRLFYSRSLRLHFIFSQAGR